MKKLLLSLIMSVMLVGNAQAGILILTGDIGDKFDGYKTVGWLLTIFTGITIVGLVIDGEEVTGDDVEAQFDLSDAGLEMLSNAIDAKSEGMKPGIQAEIKIDAVDAEAIINLEGFSGARAENFRAAVL